MSGRSVFLKEESLIELDLKIAPPLLCQRNLHSLAARTAVVNYPRLK